MKKVDLACSRCRKAIDGESGNGVTAGYYDLSGSWGKYAKNGERFLCDNCMWSDPHYQQDFGVRTPTFHYLHN